MTDKELQVYLKKGYVYKYGILWNPRIEGNKSFPRTIYEVERQCFLGVDFYGNDITRSKKWLGKAEHFCRFLLILLAHEKCRVPFEINPNTRRIIDRYFENDFLAVAGHGSSGKTDAIAAIAIGEFMADPENTGVIVASTTLNEARGRVWGRIEYWWQEMCPLFGGEENTPGELVSSSGIIRFKMDGKKDDTKGIKLAPGKESEVKDGIGRMKGFKARRMRFFADELSDLSHKLLDAAESNLYLNPDFKMIGTFNPARHSDPAGVFSEPEKGWDSVDVLNSEGWKTKRGYCIRFDGNTSPNVVAGYEKWRGLLIREKLEDRKLALGANSPRFMEQYRGAWSLTGHADCIYSEAEIERCMGMKPAMFIDTPILVAGFDPAWTHNGDRAPLVFLNVGPAKAFNGEILMTAEVSTQFPPEYMDDDLDTSRDRKELIVERVIASCKAKGILPKHLGMDATGGGDVLASWIATQWSNELLRVQFGGRASERPVSKTNKKDADERFANKVSELWYVGRDLLKSGQLRGLTPSMVVEMTNRLYSESGKPPKIAIEPKKDMKARINGNSPDVSDALFVAIDVARHRLGLSSVLKVANNKPDRPKSELDRFFETYPQLRKPKGTAQKKKWEPLEVEVGQGNW